MGGLARARLLALCFCFWFCFGRVHACLRPPFCHLSPAAPTLGLARLPGNRLGVALTLPMLFIGYTAGLKRAFARHLGYAENGQPPLYPGYVADSTVPQWVRHEVSDRRR